MAERPQSLTGLGFPVFLSCGEFLARFPISRFFSNLWSSTPSNTLPIITTAERYASACTHFCTSCHRNNRTFASTSSPTISSKVRRRLPPPSPSPSDPVPRPCVLTDMDRHRERQPVVPRLGECCSSNPVPVALYLNNQDILSARRVSVVFSQGHSSHSWIAKIPTQTTSWFQIALEV